MDFNTLFEKALREAVATTGRLSITELKAFR